ncbi:hypothetical protein EJ08DRAFT_607095 [Tothia fuscella]|uniref:AMMECR1 domain-containing protein n=1 Tax=Tothia fuscella TaxID=1048955 RepID=A0A9P4U2C4_9PEZI|nr:hypothetical protein EJ08DRAFT_607095 [Tothia fuscella]
MATVPHCVYCFECLSSSLEKRKPLSLAQVEELWDQYEAFSHGEDDAADAQLQAEAAAGAAVDASDTTPYKPAAISRLLNSPLSGSSSSSPAPSASSSTPSLNTTASKSSSRSSLFSLPKSLSRGTKRTSDEEEFPLFVTWNTVSSRGRVSLRGCIGTFEPHELDDGLRSYALTAALEDTRFNPISTRELPTLECGVTLLTDFEPISDPMDWDIGTHGLRISFIVSNRRYGSTYLPDVAREQGWTREETMISLMRKAGWNGRSSEWRSVRDLKVIRYQGFKASLWYGEWKEFREWVVESGRDEELDE